MAEKPGSEKRIKVNPLIAKLLEADIENAITLRGFIGPGNREGYVRLFPALSDLSRNIEIAESDILATADLPKSGLGAVAVWVKRDAKLNHNFTRTATAGPVQSATNGLSDIQRAGLRMKVRAKSAARDVCTCEYYCDGTKCVPCTSNCLTQPE